MGKKSGLLEAVSEYKDQGRERKENSTQVLPLETSGDAGAEIEGGGTGQIKSLQILSGRPNLEASGRVPRLENAGPGQIRSRPD